MRATDDMGVTDEPAVGVHALTEGQLAEIFRQAEAGYPEEICGIVMGQPGLPETYEIHQVTNIANQEPQEDPKGEKRDAQTAYFMDRHEMGRIIPEGIRAGLDVVTIYHSHPDHDAYFSEMDRRQAIWPGLGPIWPRANYLVVSVRARRVRDARYYIWDDARRDFVEVPLTLPIT